MVGACCVKTSRKRESYESITILETMFFLLERRFICLVSGSFKM